MGPRISNRHSQKPKTSVSVAAPRTYPKGLGRTLLRIMDENQIWETPIPTLRQKYDLTRFQNDERGMFQSMPMKDTWPDAKLADVFFYLWSNRKLSVPQPWKETMMNFNKELRLVSRQRWCG